MGQEVSKLKEPLKVTLWNTLTLHKRLKRREWIAWALDILIKSGVRECISVIPWCLFRRLVPGPVPLTMPSPHCVHQTQVPYIKRHYIFIWATAGYANISLHLHGFNVALGFSVIANSSFVFGTFSGIFLIYILSAVGWIHRCKTSELS